MTGNITVAKSWNELNQWQVQEVAHLYLNTSVEDFADAYLKMIFVVYQKSSDKSARRWLKKLLKDVPVSELQKHTGWLLTTTDFYKFPEVSGLIKPADRLENITIRQFSTIDTFFHSWNKDKTILNLKRLVASLYRVKEQFDDIDLVDVDAITRKLSIRKLESIALAYMFTRMRITDKYPIVFPKKVESEEEELKPVFSKKDVDYVPFDKAILAMSMDELQPLGKKQDVNVVRIYEFFAVLSESIIYHKQKAKAYEGK